MAEELEHQYSPSRWSKRFSADEVIRQHVDFAKKASDEAKRDIPYITLRYGENEYQMVDIFGTNLPQDAPLLIYIHGGYWQELDRKISSYVVKPFFQNGFRVAVAGYDLAPKVSFQKITEEILELGAFISKYAIENNIKNIWYAGHSAGAYLSALLLKHEELIYNGLILISGIYDLNPLVNTYVNDALKLSSEDADKLSIDVVKSGKKLNLLIAVAENDSEEFKRQSKELYDKLIRNNYTAEYCLVENVDHFDIVENLSDEKFSLTRKIIYMIKEN